MDNDRSVEHFFLGVIIAVVLFLVLRKEFAKLSARGGGGDTVATAPGGGGGGCGCSGGAGLPTNPGVSPGAQSLSDMLSFPASTISHGAQFSQTTF